MKQEQLEKAYAQVRENHPTVSDPYVLELLLREHIFRKKMGRIGRQLLFGASLILMSILAGDVFPKYTLILHLFALIGVVLFLASVMRFAKATHDSCTPGEAQELADYEAVSKGGRTDIDLSKYDKSAYLSYCEELERQQYRQTQGIGKLCFLLERVPGLIKIVASLFALIGLFVALEGCWMSSTYSRRMEHAVEVTAVLTDVEEDWEDEKRVYECTYEYSYDGEIYDVEKTVRRKPGQDHTIRLTIDSRNPDGEMKGNGKTELILGPSLLGGALLLTGLIVWRKSVRMKRRMAANG